jgi:hypothetical protein
MHWADEATLDLVKFLARRIQRLPVLLVLTYRDDEIGPRHPLRSVIGELPAAVAVRVPLTPLSRDAVGVLAGQTNRAHLGDQLHRATDGNPFFVTEVLAADGAGVPASIRDAVLARAARLSRRAASCSSSHRWCRRDRIGPHRCLRTVTGGGDRRMRRLRHAVRRRDRPCLSP